MSLSVTILRASGRGETGDEKIMRNAELEIIKNEELRT